MTMTMSETEDQTRFETDPYLLTQIDPTLNDDRSIGYESDKSVTSNISTNSFTANICIPVTDSIPTLPTMPVTDPIPYPTETPNVGVNETDTDNLRKYLQKQCFEGCKWTHPLLFEASQDKQNFVQMDITKFVGNSSYKGKEGSTYRIYFNPQNYSVTDEWNSFANLPEDSSVKHQVQNKFKSQSYLKLSKDLREACGTCGFNIVQNGNQKFHLKKSGLLIRNRFSCQRYVTYKKSQRNITGDSNFRKYTLHNDRKNQREQGRKKIRRGYSSRSITKETRCKFFFYINFDEYGFFVEPGIGNRYHTHHSPMNKLIGETSKDELEEDDQDFMVDMKARHKTPRFKK